MTTLIDHARSYLAWLNDAPAQHPERARELLTEDLVWTEAPTRFAAEGREGDLEVMLEALKQTEAMIDGERIIERHVTANEKRVVLEVEWTGRIRATGQTLRADGVTILEFEGQRIRAARDYLCFDAPAE